MPMWWSARLQIWPLNVFLGLAPEDSVIEPSSLTKFRKLRIKDEHLLDLLIHKSVQIVIEHHLITSKIFIMDATHTKAHYNHKKPHEVLQESQKLCVKQSINTLKILRQNFLVSLKKIILKLN